MDAAQHCYADDADLLVPAPPVNILLMPSSEDGIRAKQPREARAASAFAHHHLQRAIAPPSSAIARRLKSA